MKNFTITIIFLLLSVDLFADNTVIENYLSDDPQIEVLLLGVYHFNNPGMDKYNLKIDDYFSDKRQQEINEVVSLLAKFDPDKIFIELRPESQKKIDSLYLEYLTDKLDFKDLDAGRNEIFQIGFKLAKMLGLKSPDCVDANGNWLGPYVDFIADTLNLTYYNDEEKKSEEDIKSRNERFSSNTVKENLFYLNQPENISDNHSYYIDVALRVKDTAGIYLKFQKTTQVIDDNEYTLRSFDFNNIGIELVSEWYKRNFFIYRNILEKSVSGDKILIIFGQGHISILNDLLNDNPKYKVITPLEYLK